MDIKPIRDDADYQAALREIEKLLDSQPGTPEDDWMEVLVTLVEAYETNASLSLSGRSSAGFGILYGKPWSESR
jgi:antitoxin component HigA of HigAB toxin-antitoxin module